MKTSETVTEISKAIIEFESEMEIIKKESLNPFLEKNYADLPSIIRETKPLLKKNGLGVVQGGYEGQMGVINVVTRLIHESGEWIEAVIPMVMVKQDPQSCGAVMTYGRRYGLQAMLNLSTEDDDAESAIKRPKQKPEEDVI